MSIALRTIRHAIRRPPGQSAGAVARVGHAWCALALVHIVTLLAGFSRLQHVLAAVPVHRGVPRARQRIVIGQTRVAVERAQRCYVAPVACLQRSAACVYLLRRRGVPAELVIGVRTPPFEAHAWAEVEGAVVNDDAAVTGSYTVITRV